MSKSEGPSSALLLTMAVTAGAVVANLYYSQPLLAEIGQALGVAPEAVARVPALTQLGYATGIFTLVPLGDLLERKRLILILLGVVTVVLTLNATATNMLWLSLTSYALGVSCAVPQLIVPLAAGMAPPGKRGEVVGTVMSGLLTGILLARTASGLVSHWLGWRAIYALAVPVMLLLVVLLRSLLPISPPAGAGKTYPQLLASLWTVLRTQPLLIRSAVANAMSFGCFSLFWCTFTYLLSAAPFSYTPLKIGLFGLVGLAGVAAAPWAGRLSDRYSPSLTVGLGLSLLIMAFGALWLGRASVPGLLFGSLWLDLGTQITLLGNQSQIYSLPTELHSRLNALFIGLFFVGGAIGTYIGSLVWSHWGWSGVCLQGCGMAIFGLLVSRIPVSPSPSAPAS